MAKIPFNYKASLPDGRYIEGVIKAVSKDAVFDDFNKRGVMILEISEQSFLTRDIDFQRRVKQLEVAQFMRQLATMTDAGIPITRSLDVLKDQAANPTMGAAIGKIRNDVDGGMTLGDALEGHPKIFKPVSIAMVKAGEVGGFLTPDVLISIADNLEGEIRLKTQIKSAMTYPTIVMGLILAIVLGLIIFVVPRFATTFEELGSELPAPTLALLSISDAVTGWGVIPIVGLIAGIIFTIKKYQWHPTYRKYYEPIKYKFPVFGKLSQKIIISRFARNFAALLEAGLPIMQILDVVGATSGAHQIENAMQEVKKKVVTGEYMSPQLRNHPIFPPLLVEMLAVGEESGEMPSMLKKIADSYDYEAEAMTKALSSLIEPLMIAAMGVIVGGILVALYLPMFSVYGVISEGGM
jgi:type IV pilus assembly protein PilC